jgi:hypothetical protein
MAQLEIERAKNTGSGFTYTFKCEGLSAHADFDPTTGVAEVKFEEATNMVSALEAVVCELQREARVWKTNPLLPLRIDIDAGRFTDELVKVAPRFGFTGPQAAGELGHESQFNRFRAEFPLKG